MSWQPPTENNVNPARPERFHDLEYGLQCVIGEGTGGLARLLIRGWSCAAIAELVKKYPKGIGRPYRGRSDEYVLEDIARIARGEPELGNETELDTHSFPVTFFPNKQAAAQTCRWTTLQRLAAEIRQATAATKEELKWLKLGSFGDTRSDKNCLRTNDNMLEISGVEGDHDSGRLTLDAAIEIMRRCGIRCLFYTSASFIPGVREKWRILAPLSKRLSKAKRYALVARLNGLLGGHLANESFTLSLSYYYGSVNNNPDHRVVIVDGAFLDQVDGLEAGAIGRRGTLERDKPRKAATPRPDGWVAPGRNDEEIMALIKCSRQLGPTGDRQWHNSMRDAIASAVRRGWTDQQIYDATEEYCDGGWGDDDIKELIRGARVKWDIPDLDMVAFGALLRSVFDKQVEQQVAAEALEEESIWQALEIWKQSGTVARTPGMRYLISRGIDVLPRSARETVQFHGSCPWEGGEAPALVALVSDIVTGEPIGVQITALTTDGCKLGSRGLGRQQGGAIRLSPVAHIRNELAIVVGVEAALSARACGIDIPIWALPDVEGLAEFPVLPRLPVATTFAPQLSGIARLTILTSNDADGVDETAVATVRARWEAHGLRVRVGRK